MKKPGRVVVIGAGAAGLMAAIHAGEAGAETVLVERTRSGGKKILISGGGRCNVLPSRVDESRFVTDSSRNSLRKILGTWPLERQLEFFERRIGLRLLREEETGKLFPSTNRARDVRDGLKRAASEHGVRFVSDTSVIDLTREGTKWRIECAGQCAETSFLEADAVVVATGGLSVPKTGSDGTGLSILSKLGHTVHPTYPALTPIFADPSPFADLAGISLKASLFASGAGRSARATGGFLFTHRGYSGPAVLDVSHVAVRSGGTGKIFVQWSHDEGTWMKELTSPGGRTVAGVARRVLPSRLADAIVERAGIPLDLAAARLPRAQRSRLIELLVRFDLPWTTDGGYKVAEVTGGGVALGEIDPRTMESRKHAGLFLCGELLDAFGPIGGYNFLWAWVTGRAAGLGAAGL